MSRSLRFVIKTPRQTVLDAPVRAARLPTLTGQVGLRPRHERLVFAVEPGLVVLRGEDGARFAGTAGGLFEGDGALSVLYTPFAVVGERGEEVIEALDRALAVPDSELRARRKLGELEQHILKELRDRVPLPRAGVGHE